MISGASEKELDIANARADLLLEIQQLKQENEQLKEQMNIMSEAFDELEQQKQDYTQVNILEMKLEKENNILTEFEKWLEEKINSPKLSLIEIITFKRCLEELQELKENNNASTD